ncbi:Xaa-Pro peptidase family protein [Desulfuromonas sp. AOP6]|uniref:M24 family metallopeptidase n=1 Tax=Desulfuromonas sp. AOP6 TaxID=1566351 RepID=UPI00127A5C28|nr:Xaa-Pro peptidase family protein [Desulfuromonas sp. AOP6]BCA80191.1 integrase [Desulfuromonas sp. AOP6]
MVKDRTAFVQAILAEHKLDALLFTGLANIRYLSGFTGSDGALILTRGKTCFLTDSRYTSQARQQVETGDVLEYRLKAEGVTSFLLSEGCLRVGFEAESMTCAEIQRLKESNLSLDWIPLGKELRDLRTIKQDEEVAFIEKAAVIASEAFFEVLPQIRPGVSERDIALALEFAMRRLGGEDRSFDLIVASGIRGALPHGVASDKAIAEGDLVTIDFGTRLAGYHSDETVTLAVGEVSSRLRNIYDIVLEAHDRAMQMVRPGVRLQDVDAAAREHILAHGYGDFFGHGLGHGVGLQVHEAPTLSARSDDVATAGMVFTIEPGVYIPGTGGVRIEDMVLVTRDGYRVLTKIPKNFTALPGGRADRLS